MRAGSMATPGSTSSSMIVRIGRKALKASRFLTRHLSQSANSSGVMEIGIRSRNSLSSSAHGDHGLNPILEAHCFVQPPYIRVLVEYTSNSLIVSGPFLAIIPGTFCINQLLFDSFIQIFAIILRL